MFKSGIIIHKAMLNPKSCDAGGRLGLALLCCVWTDRATSWVSLPDTYRPMSLPDISPQGIY